MPVLTPKRAMAQSQMARKKKKLASEMMQLAEQEENNVINADLAEILQHLLANPSQIKKAKLAIIGGLCDDTPCSKEDHFNPTYTYLPKIPKTHLVNVTLPKLSAKLEPDMVQKMCKLDRRVDLKLLYFATGTDPSQKLMSHHKATLDELFVKRAKEFNNTLDHLKWGSDGKIKWHLHGLYRLLPEMQEGSNPASHKYTKVKCLALAPDDAEVLPVSKTTSLASRCN